MVDDSDAERDLDSAAEEKAAWMEGEVLWDDPGLVMLEAEHAVALVEGPVDGGPMQVELPRAPSWQDGMRTDHG